MKVLKFQAEWCGPCKSLSKLIEDYYKGDVVIEAIDIDQNREMAMNMGVRAVPTCILVDDAGVEIGRKTGMMMIDDFEKFVKGE